MCACVCEYLCVWECVCVHVCVSTCVSGSVNHTLSLRPQAPSFEVYITYCENKPKSESFIWTYLHTGGTFFEVSQPAKP